MIRLFRKIRSEALSDLDRDIDDVVDMIKMKRENDNPSTITRERNFVIATYPDNDAFRHCQIKTLDYYDYRTLQLGKSTSDAWLSNFIIDLALACMLQENAIDKKEITVVNCNVSGIIFRTHAISREEAEVYSEDELKVIPTFNKKLIMPVNVGGSHWVLAIANIQKKIFNLIDPMGNERNYKDQYFAYFLNTLGKLKYNIDNWKNNSVEHVRQKTNDNYNCGVYVLLFAERTITEKSLTITEDPDHYRNHIKALLLRNSLKIVTRPPN